MNDTSHLPYIKAEITERGPDGKTHTYTFLLDAMEFDDFTRVLTGEGTRLYTIHDTPPAVFRPTSAKKPGLLDTIKARLNMGART